MPPGSFASSFAAQPAAAAARSSSPRSCVFCCHHHGCGDNGTQLQRWDSHQMWHNRNRGSIVAAVEGGFMVLHFSSQAVQWMVQTILRTLQWTASACWQCVLYVLSTAASSAEEQRNMTQSSRAADRNRLHHNSSSGSGSGSDSDSGDGDGSGLKEGTSVWIKSRMVHAYVFAVPDPNYHHLPCTCISRVRAHVCAASVHLTCIPLNTRTYTFTPLLLNT